MVLFNHLLNKSYYELINEVNQYNKINNRNIKFIISKINGNLKFVKYISSKDYYYIYLETKDEEICNQLKEILKLPYESDQRQSTNHYISRIIENEEYMKKINVSHIFQKNI
jgi:hypothetical protein